ncbi:MAG: hypothetical protein V2I32_01005 [Desulforhopalus sp.]|jgi:hypothetical protein|nr:hypothetical protein [Desulforhopalus sp.]
MEKSFYHISPQRAAALLFSLMIFSLSGCTALLRTVPIEKQISLNQSDTGPGEFRHGDLTVDYTLTLDGRQMAINGRIAYQKSFDSLDVSLLVIDAAGTVMQQKLIYSSGFRTSTDRIHNISFSSSLVLPPGSQGISFRYTAQDRRSYR